MWNGGAGTTAVDPKTLRENYDRADAAAQVKKEAQDDASEALAEGRGARSEKESDERQLEMKVGGVQGLQDSVRTARETAEQVAHANAEKWRELEPERRNVSSSFDMARFYQWRFNIDFFGAWSKGILERILENQNFGGALILFFHALGMKMTDASLSTRTSASAVLNPNQYFKVADVGRNTAPEQLARAQSEAKGLADKEDAIRNREKDPYYDSDLDKKKNRLAKMETELAKAKADAAAATQHEKDMLKKRNEARAEYDKAVDEKRKAASEANAASAPRSPGRPPPAPAAPSPAQIQAAGILKAQGQNIAPANIPEAIAKRIAAATSSSDLQKILAGLTAGSSAK
ncbi:MAG: hypothetical protein V2A66_05115 [Pseudomonadota bacterium]